MNKFERTFGNVCDRLNLNPSGWIPHITSDGVYEMGVSYASADDLSMEGGRGVEVPIESFSLYNTFWLICYTRRHRRQRSVPLPRSRWEILWSFLSDVDLGIYDTKNWVNK